MAELIFIFHTHTLKVVSKVMLFKRDKVLEKEN